MLWLRMWSFTRIELVRNQQLDNYTTVGGDGGCRVGELLAGTTSPMPRLQGIYATATVRDPYSPFLSVFLDTALAQTLRKTPLSTW